MYIILVDSGAHGILVRPLLKNLGFLRTFGRSLEVNRGIRGFRDFRVIGFLGSGPDTALLRKPI